MSFVIDPNNADPAGALVVNNGTVVIHVGESLPTQDTEEVQLRDGDGIVGRGETQAG